MNILCIRTVFLCFLFWSTISLAQKDTEVFHEHDWTFRHGFSKNYSANFELSSRAYVVENSNAQYRLRQLQVGHFSTLKLDLKQSIALGIMLRNRRFFDSNSSNEFRLTQQYNIKSLYRTLRFGHRFRSEQRFYNNFTAFRFRYRFAIDVPLQGLKLDYGETYFVITNEGLLTTSNILKPELEYRISPNIGLLLSEELNLDFGLELRLDKFNLAVKETLFFYSSITFNI
ncbi:DUF2490 domain-containing protein [Psychroserpens sp. BH13MA-6]